MIYICILLQLLTLVLFIIWFKPFKKKQTAADISNKEYLRNITELIPKLPDDPPRLHQYKGFVIKTEKKKQKWHHEIWDNAMTKKLMVGNSLATDKRSYEELIKDIENDIDESPEKYI